MKKKYIPKNCRRCSFMNKQDYLETSIRYWTKLISRRRFTYLCLKSETYIALDDKRTRPDACPLG